MAVHCDEGCEVLFPCFLESNYEGGELAWKSAITVVLPDPGMGAVCIGQKYRQMECRMDLFTHVLQSGHAFNLPSNCRTLTSPNLLHRPHFAGFSVLVAIYGAETAPAKDPETIPDPMVGRPGFVDGPIFRFLFVR